MVLYQTPEHKHCYRHVTHVYKPFPKHWWQRIFYKPESIGRLLKCECGAIYYATGVLNILELIDIARSIFENYNKKDFGHCFDQMNYDLVNEFFNPAIDLGE